jgi:hypothetical protein
VTEYATKLTAAFFKGYATGYKRAGYIMTNFLCTLAGICGVLVRNISNKADGKIWTGALANLSTGIQHVSVLPFGILGLMVYHNDQASTRHQVAQNVLEIPADIRIDMAARWPMLSKGGRFEFLFLLKFHSDTNKY